MNFGKFIGIPYKHQGYSFSGCDCWGLLRLIYKECRDIELPTFTEYLQQWYKQGENHIQDNIQNVRCAKVDPPYKLYDGILFYRKTIVTHIGMYIGNNKFIHVLEKSDSRVDKIEGYWKDRLYGSWRYE